MAEEMKYREVYVKMTVPSKSWEHAHQIADQVVNARLSLMIADEPHEGRNVPIKAEVSKIMGGTYPIDRFD